MIGGQTLVMRSWHPPPLMSLFRAGGDVVFVYSSPSASKPCSRQWFSLSCDAESVRKKVIDPLSSFTEAAGLRPNSERLRFPRSAMAQPTPLRRPFSWLLLHAGCHLRNLCSSRASQYSDSSVPIDSTAMQSMERKIKEQLSADAVSVKDAYGDGRHVSIDVISLAFEGQSAVDRQRMVYKAIWEELQSTVHAVDQMTTRTPAEAAGKREL